MYGNNIHTFFATQSIPSLHDYDTQCHNIVRSYVTLLDQAHACRCTISGQSLLSSASQDTIINSCHSNTDIDHTPTLVGDTHTCTCKSKFITCTNNEVQSTFPSLLYANPTQLVPKAWVRGYAQLFIPPPPPPIHLPAPYYIPIPYSHILGQV